MKIKEVRVMDNFQLVDMRFDDKEFAYSQVDDRETFEVYHLDDKKSSGFRYSRAYRLNKGQVPPAKYNNVLEFLKSEFNKINWDAKYVEYKLLQAK